MKKILLTDLDGTLLPSDGVFRDNDIKTLISLKDKGVVRAIVTGRSLWAAEKVLKDNFPIDYLIFSSGAGVMDWNTKNIEKKEHLSLAEINSLKNYLINNQTAFFIHHPIPKNHFCTFNRGNKYCVDFEKRLSIYKNFAVESENYNFKQATQFIIIKDDGKAFLQNLKNIFPNLNFITTTTFTSSTTLWAEVFPKNVSKGLTSKWLCDKENIKYENTFCIGNDFNDKSMLDWANSSFVVENAPDTLRKLFKTVKSCMNGGFSEAVNRWLSE